MYLIKLKNNKDLKISITLMASFVVLTLQYLVLIIFNLINTQAGSIVQTLSKLIVAIFFIYTLPIVWKRAGKVFLLIYGVAIFFFLLQFLFYLPNRSFILDLIFPFFFISLPALIYTLAIRDFKIFLATTKISAYIVFVFGLIIGIYILSGKTTVGVYSMSLSYYMLLPALIFLGDFLDKYRVSSFFFFLGSMIIILSLGSRGTLLCIAIFFLLKLIRIERDSSKKSILFRFAVILSTFVLILQYTQILSWINDQLIKYGVSSRTIRLLQQDEISLSGRDSIANVIVEGIMDNPLFGIGLSGDRAITGFYSHNFIIEMLSGFGLILGSILVIIIILLITRTLIISDKSSFNIISLWLSLGFVHLMVSGSYIIEMKFWIFLGIIIQLNFRFENRKLINYE